MPVNVNIHFVLKKGDMANICFVPQSNTVSGPVTCPVTDCFSDKLF